MELISSIANIVGKIEHFPIKKTIELPQAVERVASIRRNSITLKNPLPSYKCPENLAITLMPIKGNSEESS